MGCSLSDGSSQTTECSNFVVSKEGEISDSNAWGSGLLGVAAPDMALGVGAEGDMAGLGQMGPAVGGTEDRGHSGLLGQQHLLQEGQSRWQGVTCS